MEIEAYLQMAALEDQHWWFVARRKILNQVVTNLNLPPQAEILEVGCGTGGNLAMLKNHGQVHAMEMSEVAREFALKRQISQVQAGRLPDQIPFPKQTFDLIAMCDVLEHLDEDGEALQALINYLKPGGKLLITVPANPWLWSQHDEINHHRRRYTRRGLRQVVRNAGYTIYYCSYFNSILFPIVAIIRSFQKILGKENGSDLAMPRKWVNQLLNAIFASERHILGRLSFPFGVSLLLLAQKTAP